MLKLKSELGANCIGAKRQAWCHDANTIDAELAATSPLALRQRRRGQGAWR
jgi:hypothetical protein